MASNKQQPESSTKPPPSFKQQLDHAAVQSANNGNGAVQNTLDTVIDKVTEYVPAAGNVLNNLKSQEEEPKKSDEELKAEARKQSAEAKADDSNTPQRPLHDNHIEDFVREQHRSKQDVLGEAGKK